MLHTQGLQMVEKDTHRVILLASHTPAPPGSASSPVPIRFANDLDISRNGTVFFTDSQPFGPTLNAQGSYDALASTIVGIAQVCYDPAAPAHHSACSPSLF